MESGLDDQMDSEEDEAHANGAVIAQAETYTP